jgi:hypothetical protein
MNSLQSFNSVANDSWENNPLAPFFKGEYYASFFKTEFANSIRNVPPIGWLGNLTNLVSYLNFSFATPLWPQCNLPSIILSQPCRNKIREILREDVELFSSVNARRKKDIENPARGIAKTTKHGNVQCIAGYNMVFLSRYYSILPPIVKTKIRHF